MGSRTFPSTDMKTIAQQIDRDGEYRRVAQKPVIDCEHCHLPRVQVKDGLCVTCRRVLGLMHAPTIEAEDDGQ